MKLYKYMNLYSKWLYTSNSKAYGNGYMEVQLHKSGHGGLRVLVTDGFKFLKDVHCTSLVEAKNEFRKQVRAL